MLHRAGFRRKPYAEVVEVAIARRNARLRAWKEKQADSPAERLPVSRGLHAKPWHPRPRKAKVTQDGDSAKDIKVENDQLVRDILALRDKKCFTCPAREGLQVGHLFRRGVEAIRWSLENNHAQCDSCNAHHNIEPHHYQNEFKRQFGRRAWNSLSERARRRDKLTYLELLDIRDHLRSVRDALRESVS
jgi:hypothetical protein